MTPTMKMKTMPAAKLRSRKSRPDEGLVRGESNAPETSRTPTRRDDRLIQISPDQTSRVARRGRAGPAGADGETQGEAEPVQLCIGVPVGVRQEARCRGRRGADRQVDIENPAPAVIRSEPATEHRTRTGPTMTTMPNNAIAEPRRSGGLMSISTDCESGTRAAPNMLQRRNSTICTKDCAIRIASTRR